MKRYLILFILVTFFCVPSTAELYKLYNSTSRTNDNKKNNKGSRSIKRPLVIDVTNKIITVPNQIMGYNMVLTTKEGFNYSTIIEDKIILTPQLEGLVFIQIEGEDNTYFGTIFF